MEEDSDDVSTMRTGDVIELSLAIQHVVQSIKTQSSKEGVELAACITEWLKTGQYDKSSLNEKQQKYMVGVLKARPVPGSNALATAKATYTWFQMASNYARNLGVMAVREAVVICGAQLLRTFVESVAQLDPDSSAYAGGALLVVTFAQLVLGIVRDGKNGNISSAGAASRLAAFLMVLIAAFSFIIVSVTTAKDGISSVAKLASHFPGYFSLCVVKDLAFYIFPARNNVVALAGKGVMATGLLYSLMQWLIAGYATGELQGYLKAADPNAYAMLGGITIGAAGAAALLNTVVDVIDDATAPHILRYFQIAPQQQMIMAATADQDAYENYEAILQKEAKKILKETDSTKRNLLLGMLNRKMLMAEHDRLIAKLDSGRVLNDLEIAIYKLLSSKKSEYANESPVKYPASVLVHGGQYQRLEFDKLESKLFAMFKDATKGAEPAISDDVLLEIAAEYFVDAVIENCMPMPAPNYHAALRRRLLEKTDLLPLVLRAEVARKTRKQLIKDDASLHHLTKQNLGVIWKQESGKWDAFLSKFLVTNPLRAGFYYFLFTFLGLITAAVEKLDEEDRDHVILFMIVPAVFFYYCAFYMGHDSSRKAGRKLVLPNTVGAPPLRSQDGEPGNQDENLGRLAAQSVNDAISALYSHKEDSASASGTKAKADSTIKTSSVPSSSSESESKVGGVDTMRSNRDSIYFEKQLPKLRKCAVHVANMMIAYEDSKAKLLDPQEAGSKDGDDIGDFEQNVVNAVAGKELMLTSTVALFNPQENQWNVMAEGSFKDLNAVHCIGITYSILDSNKQEHVHSVLLARDKLDPTIVYLLDPREAVPLPIKSSMSKAVKALINGEFLPKGSIVQRLNNQVSLLYRALSGTSTSTTQAKSPATSTSSTSGTKSSKSTTSTTSSNDPTIGDVKLRPLTKVPTGSKKPQSSTSSSAKGSSAQVGSDPISDAQAICSSAGSELFALANCVFADKADASAVIESMVKALGKQQDALVLGVCEHCMQEAAARFVDDADCYSVVDWLVAEALSHAHPKQMPVAELQAKRYLAEGRSSAADKVLSHLGEHAV